MAALRRWGLLDESMASGCPPVERYTFDFGPVVIAGTPHPSSGSSMAFALRRTVLDKPLFDAAAREGITVEEILIDAGTVVGIRGHGAGGRSVVERARIVVGADGWNSVVARGVGAERCHAKTVLEHAFYTY